MKKKQAAAVTTKEPRDVRYIRKYFGPDPKVFQTSNKGFVPLPIIVRKLLRHLTPPELRVLVYLQTRASKYGLCFPTLEEIVYELGLSGRKNLTPRLKSLEEKKLIATRTAEGKKFFLVLDPRVAIEHLAATGKLGSGQLDEINQLYEDLKQPPIELHKKSAAGG